MCFSFYKFINVISYLVVGTIFLVLLQECSLVGSLSLSLSAPLLAISRTLQGTRLSVLDREIRDRESSLCSSIFYRELDRNVVFVIGVRFLKLRLVFFFFFLYFN